MLEQLLESLQNDKVGKEVEQKAGIDADMMSQIMKIAGGVATQQVAKEMTSGGLDSVMNLFSNKENNNRANSLQDNITNNVVSSIVEKMGLDESKAALISSFVIPAVMDMVTEKNSQTPDDDASPLMDLFKGNQAGGITDLIGGFLK